ncbi:pickpocket protein 28 isoform X2 [Nilaparvata lugens]|uniref:pickpocket protein 28 isoform X2 n=1 Tax=Nilaparvata lugens TaxID=108931 RepID=UPI00193D8BB1|nr:pickpocket protein 28 isoform X2 [Nilaparvata lugens]
MSENETQQQTRGSIRRHIEDFCEESSLVGVKYVVAKGRPLFERVWWMLVILCSFLLSFYLIQELWVKWNPVIVSFAQKPTSVWEIPFPAVTICSKNKVKQSVFNFTKYVYKNSQGELAEDEIERLSVVGLLCGIHNEVVSQVDKSRIDLLEEVTDHFLVNCEWQSNGIFTLCTDFLNFTRIMTDDGYCFTSNSLSHSDIYHKDGLNSKYLKLLPNASEWDLENGYKDNYAFKDYHPRRAIGPGLEFSLIINMVQGESDFDQMCSGDSRGFKVTLHNPAEIATVSRQFYNVPINKEVFLAVKPNMMTTSSNLRSYSPERRQCYFAHERELAFFKVYTKKNCELECLTNHTLKECGCVAFYMPSAKDTPICGPKKYYCLQRSYRKMITESLATMNKEVGVDSSCNCLQSCTSLEYDAETSQGPIDVRKWRKAGYSYSRLFINFKEAQFIATHRSALYGLSDFLGICGGLLGLTNGFCILSLVELIYYLTLRLYRNFQKKKKPNDTEMENVGE